MPCSAYLERLRRLVDEPGSLEALEGRLTSGARALVRAERARLAPSWGRAGRALLLSLALTVAAVAGARQLLAAGAWWPLMIPLVYAAGLGVFGLFSLFHDAAHGSFLPHARLNAAAGWIL